MGFPVAGNPTQFVMERAFEAAGVDSRCLTVDVPPADLRSAVEGMKAMGFRGAVLADPHQHAACDLVSKLTRAATILGEIDVLYREEEELVGANATLRAITEILVRHRDLANSRVVVVGAGATARAAALAVGLAGASRITIVARDDASSDQLLEILREHVSSEIEGQAWVDLYRFPPDTDIAIQTTFRSGLDPADPLLLDYEGLSSGLLLLDSVYNPPRTEFVRQGERTGCVTIDGLDLLVQKVSVAFQMWTGTEPDSTVVRDAFEEFLMI